VLEIDSTTAGHLRCLRGWTARRLSQQPEILRSVDSMDRSHGIEMSNRISSILRNACEFSAAEQARVWNGRLA